MLKDLPFGVEIEMTGLTREQAAKAVAKLWETTALHHGGTYDDWQIIDPAGKKWKIMYDSSISAERWNGTSHEAYSDGTYKVEMVTPKLEYDEIPKLQEVVRVLRKAHAKVNESCGLHVHVDASRFDNQSLKNLMSIMYSKEDLLFQALQVPESRVQQWCKPVREGMLTQARRMTADASRARLERIWYQGNVSTGEHYNWTRYHALNLHSVFYRGTVEYRMFNSTLHAGRVKAYVHLALGISSQALEQRGSQMRKTVSDNPAFTFRTWLLRMGMIGEEYANTREHLLAFLPGNRAWRYDKDHYEKNNSRQEPER
jgi:hypothetical protein